MARLFCRLDADQPGLASALAAGRSVVTQLTELTRLRLAGPGLLLLHRLPPYARTSNGGALGGFRALREGIEQFCQLPPA